MGRKLTIDRCKLLKSGGASRDRTDDLIVANDALSQLSYSPADLPDLALHFNSATIVSPIRHGLRLHVLKLERIEHAGVSDAHTSVHRVGPVKPPCCVLKSDLRPA